MKKVSTKAYDTVGKVGKYAAIAGAVFGLLEAGTKVFEKVTEPQEEVQETKKKGGRKHGKA